MSYRAEISRCQIDFLVRCVVGSDEKVSTQSLGINALSKSRDMKHLR